MFLFRQVRSIFLKKQKALLSRPIGAEPHGPAPTGKTFSADLLF